MLLVLRLLLGWLLLLLVMLISREFNRTFAFVMFTVL